MALMSPDVAWIPTGTSADTPHWRHVAQQYADALPENPSARQWLRLADLWDQGDRPARAAEAAQRAADRVRIGGGHIQMVAVATGKIDWLVPAGDEFVISRRLEPHGAMAELEPMYRIELWSPDERDRPVWGAKTPSAGVLEVVRRAHGVVRRQ